jgi:hypothetical protein
MTKKYQSKVSYGLLIFIFLVFFGPLIPHLIKTPLQIDVLGLIGFLLLVFVFILQLFFKTQYTIDNKKLKIKCGLFYYTTVEIDEIKEISKTKNIISSPAASFDRIEIKYGKFDEIIISPQNKFDFAKDLTQINPKIKNNITE